MRDMWLQRESWILILTMTIFHFNPAASYDILGICSTPTKSHWSTCESVLRAVSNAGHKVGLHLNYIFNWVINCVVLPSPGNCDQHVGVELRQASQS